MFEFRNGLRSLGSKLMLSVVLVVVIAGAVAAHRLGLEARHRLIDAKVRASLMLANLAAETLEPAIDFGDREAANTELSHLRSNQDITYAGVWASNSNRPMVETGHSSRVHANLDFGLAVLSDHIEVSRPLIDPSGKRIGSLVTEVSLKAENEQFAATRRDLYSYAALLCLFVSAVVLGVMRRQVIQPLGELVAATRAVRSGSRVMLNVSTNDEIGTLGDAFNVMSAAITDREEKLALANFELKQLLEHMRQAIVVFGADGKLVGFRSKQAGDLFGEASSMQAEVVQLLYPDDTEGVEAEAFREWKELAFSAEPAQWDEVCEFAPTRTTLRKGSPQERSLQLDFIPIAEGVQTKQIMLLATDVTDTSRLERKVREQDVEHAKQLSAMRHLLAGGGHLLIALLEGSRERIQRCHEVLDCRALNLASVESMFRQMHTIKGEARAFDLSRLERAAAAFEDHLMILRPRLAKKGNGSDGSDLDALRSRLRDVEWAVEAAQVMLIEASPIGPAIIEQITVRRPDLEAVLALVGPGQAALHKAVHRLAARPFGECLIYLGEAVPNWAERCGKRVELVVEGRDVPVPMELARVLPAVMTHLARNAVAHGIEPVDERQAGGKPAGGTIRVEAEEIEEELEIRFSDDGQGLRRPDIKARAAELGLTGEAEELVFAEGFSTGTATILSGRGVGLGAVREELERVSYSIELVGTDVGAHFRIFPFRDSQSAIVSA